MSASNIYLRLITATGPVIGEGLLEGWETSIELISFEWGMDVRQGQGASTVGLGSLASLVGLGKTIVVEPSLLKFTKRFDVASAHIHASMDNDLLNKVVSATITVLHMKPNVVPPHAPGFVLNFLGGKFKSVQLRLETSGNMAELQETVEMEYTSLQMQYLKPIEGQPTPMAPFVYAIPTATITV
jgi:type VI protein secretion system component Hcp